jgi:hypothetical protein
MSIKTVKRVLDQHGIEYKMIHGDLWCVDAWTKDGQYDHQWIKAPMKSNDLLAFLGY